MSKESPVKEAFPELYVAPDKQGRVKTFSATGRKMNKKIDELIARLNKLGFKLATVVNLNPFAITTDIGYNGRHTVKACKTGVPYVSFVIKTPLYHPIEKPEGERDVDAIMPVELAGEFVGEMRRSIYSDKINDGEDDPGFNQNASIGVFWYEGSSEAFPTALYDRARELQGRWFERLFEEAENIWAKSQNRREIHDRMRDAAHYMLSIKAIDVLPEWVTAKADVKGAEVKQAKTKACPVCSAIANINAILCLSCQTMFDPGRVKQLRPDIYFAQRPNEKPQPKEPKPPGQA